MLAGASSRKPLASIIKHNQTVTALLRKAKSRARSNQKIGNIDEKVEFVIMGLVGEFNLEQGPALFPEESFTRMLKKIGDILQEFIIVDPHSKLKYETLVTKINELKPRRDQSSMTPSWSSPIDVVPSSQPSSSNEQPSDFGYAKEGAEKQCLLCFTLFPAGADIKRRELIHIWIGMELIDGPLDGDNMLAKFVLEGFIERVIGNKRLTRRYRMHESVNLDFSAGASELLSQTTGSWSVIHKPEQQDGHMSYNRSHTMIPRSGNNNAFVDTGKIEALLNINQTALNAHRFEYVSKMKSLKVLHLGSWRPDPEIYIVAEGIEALKELKLITSLSLCGVTGLRKLPESLYRLYNLKVLDLKACHNLELINADGLVALRRLTHMDLSECYLLDHVPKGIIQLTQLQVLKGFVVNPLPPTKKSNGTQENHASPCAFSDLSQLTNLIKLTIRSRIVNFPTAKDLEILCCLDELICLRIAWVASSNDCQPYGGIGGLFPKKLKKLELQAAPDGTASRLLALISSTKGNNCLEKLYIRGGGLSDVSPRNHHLPNVKVLRLKHLHELYIDWDQLRESFPCLTSLEMIGCPNLLFFPCDGNGVWVSKDSE